MKNEKVKRCCICGNNKYQNIKKVNVNGGSLNLVRCKKCGLIFFSPRLTQSYLKRYYSHDSLNQLKNNKRYAEEDMREFTKRLKLVEKYVKKDSVLDVGCSTGTFLLCCKKLGYKDVHGVDLNKKTNEYCIKKLKLPVSAAIPNKKFNLIHLSDIIEHVQDPDKFIESIKKRSVNKGIMLLTTPNINNPLNWILNIKPKEHLSYFSKRTIRLLLEKNDLKLIKIKSWNRYHPLQHLVDTSTGEKVRIARILIALKLDILINKFILKNLYTDILVIAQNLGK